MGVTHSVRAVAEEEHRCSHFFLEPLIVQTSQHSVREGSHMIEVRFLGPSVERREVENGSGGGGGVKQK